MPTFILIMQLFGHNTPTSQTVRQTVQQSDSIGQTVLQTVAQKGNGISRPMHLCHIPLTISNMSVTPLLILMQHLVWRYSA